MGMYKYVVNPIYIPKRCLCGMVDCEKLYCSVDYTEDGILGICSGTKTHKNNPARTSLTQCTDIKGNRLNTESCLCGTNICRKDEYCFASGNTCLLEPHTPAITRRRIGPCINKDGKMLLTQNCICGNTPIPYEVGGPTRVNLILNRVSP